MTAITGPSFRVGTLKSVSGTEQGHDAGNLPRLAPKRQSRTILIVLGEPARLKRWPEWATSMASIVMDARSPLSLPRTVALVGLMGAGKSAIGKRLAMRLGLPFVDADDEIERAAGCSIAEIFEKYGEADFRAGERRVISRLLDEPPHVLSTGGGAYIDPETRALMRAKAVTVWLRAELDVLFDRVRKRGHRPLLRNGDPKEVLARLMTQRYPIYAEADIVVEFDGTARRPHDRAGDRGAARPSADREDAGMSHAHHPGRVGGPQLRHRDRPRPDRPGRRAQPAPAGGAQGHDRERRDRGAALRRPARGLVRQGGHQGEHGHRAGGREQQGVRQPSAGS